MIRRTGAQKNVPLDDAARRRAERTALAGNIRRGRASGGSSARAQAPRRRGRDKGAFTGRLVILLGLLLFCFVLIAPQMKVYVKQRQEVADIQADIAAQKAEKQRLTNEVARYNDDAYIRQQARDRLFMVMPGETRYMVVGELPGQDQAVSGSADSQSQLSWSQSYTDALRQAAR
ncbi:septum formation initiator family protein [Falsarthrobacter nasiphocae]|uniref:Cell division protein FtsB n=1 Tax=Falsarthrobacter nasiphocae TaxID=189863 RepID=A0AAE4C7Q4_9MICC|nr:septum formation initiator family protein [Falsarthrobacter nasiphocae]MDR6891655.1 cell division protein FtsB [Falsarthrobacter nasiphocae]